MKRIPQRELLDDDSGTPEEIANSLEDLRRINRLFGGTSTTEHLLRRAIRKTGLQSANVLEVAAGSADCIQYAAKRLRNEGVELHIIALDRNHTHLPTNGIKTVVGDALHLPFENESFDFVSCALFVHHLGPEEVVQFIDEGLRVCRTAVLINDLRRSPTHLALVYAGFPLFRSRITRNDGPASVKQAYERSELAEMISRTKAASCEIEERYLYRFAVTVWK